jgi:hypothetical protein
MQERHMCGRCFYAATMPAMVGRRTVLKLAATATAALGFLPRACPNRQGAVVDFVLLLRRLGVAAAHRLSSRRSSWCTRYGQAAGERTPPAWVMSADWGEPGITVAVR